MPCYRVKLIGENFRLTVEGKIMKLGFLTTKSADGRSFLVGGSSMCKRPIYAHFAEDLRSNIVRFPFVALYEA